MENAIIKHLVLEVDGEATVGFVVASLPDGQRISMLQSILDSNPTLRLVDSVVYGGIWNGTEYVIPE